MNIMSYDTLMKKIEELYDIKSTNINDGSNLTLGIVVNTDDDLQQNRLQVFCPALNDNPKKLQQLPWALVSATYGGSINNASYTRGNDPANCTTQGAVQYGWWSSLEQGAHVIVGCFDADPRRRFVIGSVYEHQEVHGILTGRWKWGQGGSVDGPLSSTDSPIEPLYTNLKKAFNGDNSSREWKTRAAEYQVCAVREDVGQIPNSNKGTYLDQQVDKIAEFEQDPWVKPILGSNGYDWSGHKGLGSFLASRVWGFSSPGMHSLLMDDRAFNSRVRIRTGAGHQIIMDDTNERIYISTNEGNNFIEMDSNGNIDCYSKRRISFHGEKDVNITAGETLRLMGKKSVHIQAGHDDFNTETLATAPEDGELRILAEHDISVITKKNYRHLSFLDTKFEIGENFCITVGNSMFTQVQNEINTIANTGDYNLSVFGNLNEIVNGDVKKYANKKMSMSSQEQAELFSFGSKLDIGAQNTINIKSISQDIAMEAVGMNGDKTGGVYIKSPESQHSVSSSGISSATNKKIKTQAQENIEMQNGVETNQDYPIPPSQAGPCNLGENEQLDLNGYSGAELAARAAYNAGFRGDALVTAVAVAGAESGYNQGAVGDVGLQSDKWGPSVGMWQVRTLNNPNEYSGLDTQRDVNIVGGDNVQANANFAYSLSNGGSNWRQWGAFTNGSYQSQLDGANAVVNRICNPAPPDMLLMAPDSEEFFETLFDSGFGSGSSIIDSCLSSLIASTGTSIILSTSGLNLQSLTDINLKGLTSGISTAMFDKIYSKINELSYSHDLLAFMTGTTFALTATVGPIAAAAVFVSQMAGALSILQQILGGDAGSILGDLLAVNFLESLGLNFNLDSICSYALPFFDDKPQLILSINNFDINNGTIII